MKEFWDLLSFTGELPRAFSSNVLVGSVALLYIPSVACCLLLVHVFYLGLEGFFFLSCYSLYLNDP